MHEIVNLHWSKLCPPPTFIVVCPNTIRKEYIYESSKEIYLVQKFGSVAEENKKLQGVLVLRAKSQTIKISNDVKL